MKTIADPGVRAALQSRLTRLTPTTARVWGRMTPHQMLVHVADGMEAAMNTRPFSAPMRSPRRLMKWLALKAPLRWPRGVRAGADPAGAVVPPEAFEADRARFAANLDAMVAAPAASLARLHPLFGEMSAADWYRWAYLHADHHLRQFGLHR